MTRPKRVRRASKRAKQDPFAAYPIVAQARVPLSPKYTVEIKLHDADGVYVAACAWDPHLPSQAEKNALQDRLDEELEPFLALALRRAGRQDGNRLRITTRRNPFAFLPVLLEARLPVSEKYTLELLLHEMPDSNNALWMGWDPHPPAEEEEDEFRDLIDAALAPFFDFPIAQPGHPGRGGEV